MVQINRVFGQIKANGNFNSQGVEDKLKKPVTIKEELKLGKIVYRADDRHGGMTILIDIKPSK